MEVECLGYPGASTYGTASAKIEFPPWLENPRHLAMSPNAKEATHHTKERGGGDGGKDKRNHPPRWQDGLQIGAAMTACAEESNVPAQGIYLLTT